MNSFWSSSTTSFKCFPFQSIFMHTKAYLQAWISQIKIQHLFDACVNSHTAIQFEQGHIWWVHKQQRDMLKHQQASYSNSRKLSTHHSLAQLLTINKLLHLFVSFQFKKRHNKKIKHRSWLFHCLHKDRHLKQISAFCAHTHYHSAYLKVIKQFHKREKVTPLHICFKKCNPSVQNDLDTVILLKYARPLFKQTSFVLQSCLQILKEMQHRKVRKNYQQMQIQIRVMYCFKSPLLEQ